MYSLFTPAHVAGASFFGSSLGGAVLLGLNARQLGKSAARPVLLGVALFVAMLLLPDGLPNFVSWFGPPYVMRALAQWEFGEDLRAHRARSGTTASWWHAIGIGLAVGGLVMVVLLAVFAVVYGEEVLRELDQLEP